MNELIAKLEAVFELPLPAKIGILVATFALVVVGYFFMFLSPVNEELTQLGENISKLQIDLVEKKGIVANLPKFEKEVDRLDVELAKALKELPDKKSIEQLLSRISDKARDAGLDIRLFKPRPEKMRDFYAEIPVEIKVTGTYHQVATFFDEVGHLARIVNVNQFEMSDPKASDNNLLLKTSAVATSFRFLEEGERSSSDSKRKKKRGRKRKT